jgi:hypothetical protein
MPGTFGTPKTSPPVVCAVPEDLPISVLTALRDNPQLNYMSESEFNEHLGWLITAWPTLLDASGHYLYSQFPGAKP